MNRAYSKPEEIDVKSLEWNLECAVVAGWSELAANRAAERVHVAYVANPKGDLDHLKVWLSVRRGHWDLVCDYRMKKDSEGFAGTAFANGFYSAKLSDSLETVMTRQSWLPLAVQQPKGMIQVTAPNESALILADQTLSALKASGQEARR